MPEDYREIYSLMKQHMNNAINGSAYNWISPSIWSSTFGKRSSVTKAA